MTTTPTPAPAPSPSSGGASPAGRGGVPVRHYALVVGVAVVVLVLDQLSKWWALDTLSTRTISVVWTLQLNLARNTGAAFSVGRGTDYGRFIPLLALAVVAVVLWQGRTVTNRLGAVAIGMIVGGAFGNLVDRALRTNGGGFLSGAVVDFIDFQWWPIFNVADMGVVVGGVLLMVATVFAPVDEPDSEAAAVVGSLDAAGPRDAIDPRDARAASDEPDAAGREDGDGPAGDHAPQDG